MIFRIENSLFLWECNVRIRESWPTFYDSQDERRENVLALNVHLYITLAPFKGKEHINWIKEAWGIMPPKPPKPVVAESQNEDELEYDPIPF